MPTSGDNGADALSSRRVASVSASSFLGNAVPAAKFGIESESLDSLMLVLAIAVSLPHKPDDNFDREIIGYGLKPWEPLALRCRLPDKLALTELESRVSGKGGRDDRPTAPRNWAPSLGDGIPSGCEAARRCSVEAISSTAYSSAMPRSMELRLVFFGDCEIVGLTFPASGFRTAIVKEAIPTSSSTG